MARERLPQAFAGVAVDHYLPLANKVCGWRRDQSVPLTLAVNGAQGTGKSTLAAALAAMCEQVGGLRSAVLSIDDLYLTKAERATLAASEHPLLKTRGVPGTHDVELGETVLAELLAGRPVKLPSFDKAVDDRRPESQWHLTAEAVDLIILEGWCVGTTAQPDAALVDPVNELEAREDEGGLWRRYVNDALATRYRTFFDRFERLVMLRAPDFDCVYRWRGKQEAKLRARVAGQADQSGVMNEEQLARFIQHYERLTRWTLSEMPARADVTFRLAEDHTIVGGRQ